MSEMVDRVARAIREEITGMPSDAPITGDGEDHVGKYTDIAIAAIEAMREPTGDMVMSGKSEFTLDDPNIFCSEPGLRDTWHTMVDAALK